MPTPMPTTSGSKVWSDTHLNAPNVDYLLSRQIRPDPIPSRPLSPVKGQPPTSASPSKQRPMSALHASFESRMGAASRPMTATVRSPPMAGPAGVVGMGGGSVMGPMQGSLRGSQPGILRGSSPAPPSDVEAVLMGAAWGGPKQVR